MITKEVIRKALNINIELKNYNVVLGLINNQNENTLSFIDDDNFINELLNNKNITSVFTTKEIAAKLSSIKKIEKIIVDDPRYIYYTLYNFIARSNYKKKKSIIHPSVQIHPTAFIADYNVQIKENTIIGPNSNILPDVYIGKNCIIKAGAVIGSEGFEFKRTSKGIISVFHDGRLIINNSVQIGANSIVYKGFSFRDTIIGEFTKIDDLVYIAHCTQIGKECLIIGNSMLCGSVTLGDKVWIGPGSVISNSLIIGNDATVSIGSVVTKNVPEGYIVSGNFAIDHSKFITFIKSIR